MSPFLMSLAGLLTAGVVLLVFAVYLMRRRKPEPKPSPDTTAVLPPPLPRAERHSLPLAPIEGDDQEEVTLETLTVGTVTPRLREVAKHGLRAGRVFNLVSNVTIGRAKDNDIVLKEEAASAHHCRLEKHGVSFRLIDLGSTNKTWVNGEEKRHVVLHNSDEVRIGDTVFIFELFGDRG